MPRTRAPKRPTGGLVELAPGIAIPSDFTAAGEHSIGSGDKQQAAGTYSLRIVTDPTEREPRVASYTLTFTEPLLVREVDDERVKRIAGASIAIKSAEVAIADAPWAPNLEAAAEHGDDDAWAAALAERTDWHRSLASDVKERLQRPRGRPERTDESKLEILDYYRAHDIHETVEHFGLAERTVRRYIAEAKRMRGEG